MPLRALPGFAAWLHRDARRGFEVVFPRLDRDGSELVGDTTAVQGDDAWAVHYLIRLDSDGLTRYARVLSTAASGSHEVTLEADGVGGWQVNGEAAGHLDGCLDVDLESSALTNAFPVHRLELEIGERAEAPAAYVRAVDLSVERLEQRYERLDDDDGSERYRYMAPAFQFECQLSYDEFGLLLDYPGIAVRSA